ncbi:MAG: hypothetical protein ACO1Q7_01065 [Gemmatimonas sp.]
MTSPISESTLTLLPGLPVSLAAHPYPQAQPAPLPPFELPMLWLLDHGSPSIQYRALVDLARIDVKSAPAGFESLPYASAQGVRLSMTQLPTGMWSGGMLALPTGASLEGVGTIPAFRRLIELGWNADTPVLSAARRVLFRLLQEDEDPHYLAELGAGATDEFLVRRGRSILREAAAAALAQAGYELDPRVRGAARRMIDRLSAYLKSPLAQKPWVRVGNQHVLPSEVAAPSFHLLVMLAHMPQFRSEHHETMGRLYTYLAQPWPRQVAVQQIGPHLIDQPHLVLGDFLQTRNAMDADMPSALAWLEIMARLGFLRRNDGWMRLFDRLEVDRDRQGVWHAPRSVEAPGEVPSWSWPLMPLTGRIEAGAAMDVDVTFRLGLIAKLMGRELVFR